MIVPLHDNAPYPRLVFTYDVDEGFEAPNGYLGDAVVELSAGETYPVYFYEPDAISEELRSREKWGFVHMVAEPGLVVIPEITLANMKAAASSLIQTGYFSHLRRVTPTANGVTSAAVPVPPVA